MELNRIFLQLKLLLLNHKFLAFSFENTFLLIFITKLDIQDIKIMNASHEYLHTQNFINTGHEKLLLLLLLLLYSLARNPGQGLRCTYQNHV